MSVITFSKTKMMVMLFRQLWLQLRTHKCLQKASSLAFNTLITLIPLSAVGLLLLKALGIFESEESRLMKYIGNYFLPNHQSFDIAVSLSEFTSNNQEQLTVGGFLFLLFILMSLFNVVESIFNDIWEAQRRTSYFRKFSVFYTILTVSPLLLWLSISASSNWLFADLLPWLIVYGFFLLMYIALPNTYVAWLPASIGSLMAGTLFQIARFIFGHYLNLGFANQHAQIYGVLAGIAVLAIWVYLVWLIIILGAEITNITQEISINGWSNFGQITKSKIDQELLINPIKAVRLFLVIAERFTNGKSAYSKSDLLKLGFSSYLTDLVVAQLISSGFVYETKSAQIIIAKPLTEMSLMDVLMALKWPIPHLNQDLYCSPNLVGVLDQLQRAHEEILNTESIQEYFSQVNQSD